MATIIFTNNFKEPRAWFLRYPYRFLVQRIAKKIKNKLAKGDLLVSSDYFLAMDKERDSKQSPTLDYDLLIRKGIPLVEAEPLLAFAASITKLAEELGPLVFTHGISIPRTLELRVVTSTLIEHVARPAEGILCLLDEMASPELAIQTLTSNSMLEIFAECIARQRGVAVKAPLLSKFSVGTWLGVVGRKLFLSRDGLPTIPPMVSYGAAESARAQDIRGKPMLFAVEERRIRRFASFAAGISGPVVAGATAYKKETIEALNALDERFIQFPLNTGLTRSEAEKILITARQSAAASWSHIEAHSNQLQHSYKGIPLFATVAPLLKSMWIKLWCESVLFTEASVRRLKNNQPSLVVVFDNGLHTTVVLQLCRRLKIPVAYYMYNPIIFFMDYWLPVLNRSMPANYFLTGATSMKAAMLRTGAYSDDTCFVVGDVFSEQQTGSEHANSRIRESLGFAATDKIVTILSSYLAQDLTYETKRKYFQSVYRGAKAVGAKVLVKSHPNETLASVQQQMRDWNIDAPIVHSESLMDVLTVSDVACMMFSQAGFEVLMSETPLVVVAQKELVKYFDKLIPFEREKAAVVVSCEEDLGPYFEKILFNESFSKELNANARRFINDFVSSLDVVPSKAIAAAVEKILENAKL